jgi:hypothetical protein
MTKEKAFEPITSQAEFDTRIKARLAREREKWEKESDSESLKAQLRAKDEEISQIQREHSVDKALRERGLSGPVGAPKAERIKMLLNFDADTPVSEQIETLSRDVPELFTMPQGAGSRGSKTPVLRPEDAPLTREEVEKMSEEEVNSNWRRVQRFLQGERS